MLTEGSVLAERYEIEQPLGQGGMGVVYKAHDRELDETVAVKVLRTDVAEAPGMAKRFRSEIKLARRVTHRNVCRIHDYGRDGPLTYIVMEYVDGRELRRVVREDGGLRPAQAYAVGRQIAEGLQAIHEVGIVHRDLKSANVMLDRQDRVKLMDFGIAKSYDSDASIGSASVAGLIVGTPEYMSPEQARGEKVDARSDVYALGVILFELFSGEVPFRGDTPVATLWKHLQEPPPLDGLLARRMPAPLIPVLERALAKSRDDRFESARALDEALAAAAAAPETRESPALATVRMDPTADDVAASPFAETTPLPATPVPRARTAPRHALGAPRAPRSRTPWLVGAALAAGAALVTAGALWLAGGRDAEPAPTPLPAPTAVAPASPAAREPEVRVEATVAPVSTPPPAATPAATRTPAATPTRATVARPTPAPEPAATPQHTPAPAAAATPAPGLLQFHVVPWAEVSVDGTPAGTTPRAPLPLAPGPHTVRLSHPSYQPLVKRITIQSGETTLLSVDLKYEAFPKAEDRK